MACTGHPFYGSMYYQHCVDTVGKGARRLVSSAHFDQYSPYRYSCLMTVVARYSVGVWPLPLAFSQVISSLETTKEHQRVVRP